MKKIKYYIIPALCAVAVFLSLRILFFVGYVPTKSMEPTIREDSFIIGSRIYCKLQVGDIITFEKDGKILVKRIAATAGTEVVDDNRVITVPEECFYVLGDNTDNSLDSRFWKEPFVKQEQIIAKVFFAIPSKVLEEKP